LNTSHHPEAGYFMERLLALLFAAQSFSRVQNCRAPGARGTRCSVVRWENAIAISRGRAFHEKERFSSGRA
jgi:hypothetical protein